MRRLRVPLTDVVLALALAGLSAAQSAADPIPVVVLDVVTALFLAWRRAYALSVALVISAVGVAITFVPGVVPPQDEVPLGAVAVLLIAAYSVGAYERSLPAAIIGGLALTVSANLDLILGMATDEFWPFRIFFFVGSWTAGRILHGRHIELDAAEERALRLAVEQDLIAERAVSAERARLARELHDVIAHNVSVMVIQAAAAEGVVADDADAARASLQHIQTAGRQTVAELRRLLGILRDSDPEMLTMPRPTLARLDSLVDQVRAAGVDVEVVVEGPPRELPASVDVSAFRIIQEGLTNTLRHSRGTQATVRVRYARDELRLSVVDNGDGETVDSAAAAANGAVGHGLSGIRERVAMFGGRFEAHTGDNGGFVLNAVLPLED